jgi:hypothetical protein
MLQSLTVIDDALAWDPVGTVMQSLLAAGVQAPAFCRHPKTDRGLRAFACEAHLFRAQRAC